MLQIIVVLFTSVVAFQSSSDSSGAARELYRRAEHALISDQPDQALPALRELVEQYPATEYALPAVVRLAELELAGDNPLYVVELLAEWLRTSTSDEASNSEASNSEASNSEASNSEASNSEASNSEASNDEKSLVRMQQLLVTALARLSDQEWENLAQKSLLFDSNDLSSGQSIMVRELAKRAAKSGDEPRALELLEKLGNNATARDIELRDFFLPLAILRKSPTAENIEQFRLKADGLVGGLLERRTSLKLAVAEAFRMQGNLRSATEVLDALALELAAVSSENAERNGAELTAESPYTLRDLEGWRASIDLRRAELFIANSQHRAAAVLLEEAIEAYPEFSLRNEYQFLLARCLIAEIKFDQALEVLKKILEHAEHSSEISARALWMMGEMELMKRQYEPAFDYYNQVASLSDQPQWQARSLLQMGKCRELQSRTAEATQLYKKIIDQFTSSEVSQVAQQRLALLEEEKLRSSSSKTGVQATGRQSKAPGFTRPR